LELSIHKVKYIQGIPGGNVNILGGHTIGHSTSKQTSVRGLLEKYPTFGREKETGLLGALDT
jgi:hypothetical protein